MMIKKPESDIVAERSILSGILYHGLDAYLDVASIANISSFTENNHKVIYECIRYIFDNKQDISKIDPSIILSASKEIGYGTFFEQKTESQYLRALFNFGEAVELDNILSLAGKIRKLEIASNMQDALLKSIKELSDVKGTESVDNLLSIAETSIGKEIEKLFGNNSLYTKRIGEGLSEFIQNIIDNPNQSYGIPSGYTHYDKHIGGGFIRKELDIIAARAKMGKAQPLDSIIYTINGPVLMKDIKVGDILLHPTKGTTKVLAIKPQGRLRKYKIKFNDKTYIECNNKHLFQVSHRRNKTEQNIVVDVDYLQSKQLKYKKRNNYYINLTNPVEFQCKNNLTIHPYVLGCLLGDGCIKYSSITLISFDKEIVNNCNKLLNDNEYSFKAIKKNGNYNLTNNVKYGHNKYIQHLKELNLMGTGSHTKFIPDKYKYTSVENRKWLLRGLLDTDGYTDGTTIEYSTVSIQLAKDVKFLVESLGGKVIIKHRYTKCNNKSFPSYRVKIAFNNNKDVFNLSRKKEIANIRTKQPLKRWITKIIDTSEKVKMQCISVDADDGLYLTNNFIITHNSLLVDNIGYHISNNLNIPILNIDTELSQEQHWIRMLSMISGISMEEIKTGTFAKDKEKLHSVKIAEQKIKSIPYYYECVGGKTFEEVLSIIRRWIQKNVGLDENGNRKPCLIIYDYIKLLNEDGLNANMQEYQKLGFIVTSLKNLLIRYDVPCLAFCQLNRDGIDSNSTSSVAGSDRILMYCSSLTFFKDKSVEEIEEDGLSNGNKKMIVVAARNGPGTDPGDYINYQLHKNIARISELKTGLQLKEDRQYKEEFGYEGDDEIDL